MVLPPSLQSSLPAGWLAFTGRELNPLDRYKRFQITFPSSFSGFVLAQGKFHGVPRWSLGIISCRCMYHEQLCRLIRPADKLSASVTDRAMEAWYHPSIA